MSAPALADLVRRAGEWLVEPPGDGDTEDVLIAVPARACAEAPLVEVPPASRYPVIAVVGLARRCGTTTLARALAGQLAARGPGAAVVASAESPSIVALGSTQAAVRLARSLSPLGQVRPAGRLCLARCGDPAAVVPFTRDAAPAVVEVEPGEAAVQAAPLVDRVVLVASPALDPPLAAAVAETISAVGPAPVVAVNRAPEHGRWLAEADVLLPEARIGARLALAGRDPGNWLARPVERLAELCLGG